MPKWLINQSTLIDIANAIRTKKGTSSPIAVSDFASEILSLTPTPPPPIERVYRDTVIIPDIYNTGCSGELTTWDETEQAKYSSLIWRDLQGLDFNDGKCLRTVSDNTEFVFENYDFSNIGNFSFNNLHQYTLESAYVRSGIKFIFKNCKFGQLLENYGTKSAITEDYLYWEYENCTFGKFAGQGHLKNCKIGGLTTEYAEKTYVSSIARDAVNPRRGTELINCLIYDEEIPTETQGTEHIDCFQSVNGRNLTINNVRIEGYNMPYEHSQGGWSYTLYLETSIKDSSVKDSIFNGGGDYGIHIASDTENFECENNIVSETINSSNGFYPSGFNYTTNGFTKKDSMYVSSIWNDGTNINIVATNNGSTAKTLKVVDNLGVEHTFNLSKCPAYDDSEGRALITEWSDLPFDKVFTISATGIEWFKCYDGDTVIRTYIKDETTI